MSDKLWTLLLLAFFLEALVEVLSPVVDRLLLGLVRAIYRMAPSLGVCPDTVNTKVLLSLLIAVGYVWGADVDLLVMVGVPMRWAWVGKATTAAFLSRGSAFVHNILSGAEKLKDVLKTLLAGAHNTDPPPG
jgi:hypothetical protein